MTKKRFIIRSEEIMGNCLAYITSLVRDHPDKEIKVEISEHVVIRSLPQNKLYFAYVDEMVLQRERIADHFGMEPDEVDKEFIHNYFKAMFVGTTILTNDGKVIHIPKSTTRLEKPQFKAYFEKCMAHATTEWVLILK